MIDVCAVITGCCNSRRGVAPSEAIASCIHKLQSKILWEHFWARGRTPNVDSRTAKEKSAGRAQRLHGLVSMCLPGPAV